MASPARTTREPGRARQTSGGGSRRRGLTLFELLIVMMILAILVSLVIGLGRYADTIGKRHHALADLGKWQEAVHRYHERLDQYPSNSVYTADVTNLLLASVQIGGAGANAMFVRFGELMPSLPPAVDPWGSAYQYVAATNQAPQSFDLYSFGPDRLGGTSDDVRFQP